MVVGIVVGMVVGIVVGMVVGIVVGMVVGIVVTIVVGIVVGIVVKIVVGMVVGTAVAGNEHHGLVEPELEPLFLKQHPFLSQDCFVVDPLSQSTNFLKLSSQDKPYMVVTVAVSSAQLYKKINNNTIKI